MYGNGIGKLQLFQLFERIFCKTAIFKFHRGSLCKLINFFQNPCISVKYTYSFIHRNPTAARITTAMTTTTAAAMPMMRAVSLVLATGSAGVSSAV